MTASASMVSLIERKKAGHELSGAELEWICREHLGGSVPDYQVSAWLMAVCWRGLSDAETLALTRAMIATGESLEWPADRPVIDKHSTGGVGDKTSLVLVPLLAAAGLTFVKMSGRGLGHTGGTLDKLESIPGYRVDLPIERLRAQVSRIGCALVGQSPELVPADGALYALRDVTATVDSLPLIASSVMAKKLAAGARALVLDVKYGSGAFMAGRDHARELARAMVAIGEGAGRRVRALLSPMDEPLGRAIGNALEVREAIEALTVGGPADLHELTLELGAHLMLLAGATPRLEDARAGLRTLLASGAGADKLEQLIAAQGGDPRVVAEPGRLPTARNVVTLPSPAAGWVERLDARRIADAALLLGAGRRARGDAIDHRAGIRLLVKRGERVERGQPLAELHLGRAEAEAAARDAFLAGVAVSAALPPQPDAAPEVVGS
jgi:pyrimidine-nucleoside phosphorylase